MGDSFDLESLFNQAEEETKVTLEEDFINESIQDESPDDLQEDLEREIKNNPNIQQVESVVVPKQTMSFNKTEVKTKSKTPQRKFITKEIIIDKFNTKRMQIELTPSVCDVCAFDVAAKYFGTWHQVPNSEREKVQKAVIEHKRIVHPLNQNLIMDEDQIPTRWLGQAR